MADVYIVEDDPGIRQSVARALQDRGHVVRSAAKGMDALAAVMADPPDVVVLDLGLPDVDGADVLRMLRATSQVPVIVATARDDDAQIVALLDAGADDYLVKPFAFPELLARIRARLRRGRPEEALRLRFADLEMDLVTRRVTRGGESLELTVREFELLEYLLRHHGQVVSREMLARDVWKEPSRATPLDSVIDVNVARLRKKVDQAFPAKLIQTVRGMGFALREGNP